MVSGMSIHLYTTTWLLQDRYCMEFCKIREVSFNSRVRKVKFRWNRTKNSRHFIRSTMYIYYCFGYLCYLGHLVTKVTTVYMVAMATMAPCLPKLPLFIGSYSTITEPEGFCSAYISYHVDHLQNKILFLKRRQQMSAGRSPTSTFMQPQQPVNNDNISNHGNSDNQHYHGNKTVWMVRLMIMANVLPAQPQRPSAHTHW